MDKNAVPYAGKYREPVRYISFYRTGNSNIFLKFEARKNENNTAYVRYSSHPE